MTHFVRKFLLISIFIIAVTQMINLFFSVSSFEKSYRKSALAQFEVLTRDLKENIETGLNRYKRYENYSGMDVLFNEALRRAEGTIDSVLATDANEKLVYLSHLKKGRPVFKKYKNENAFLDKRFFENQNHHPNQIHVQEQEEAYIIRAMIMLKGKTQGYVFVIFAKTIIVRKIYEVIKQSLVLFALTLFAATILLVLSLSVFLRKSEELDSIQFIQRKKTVCQIILISTLLLSQSIFSYFNIKTFQEYKLGAIHSKTDLLATLLKEDIEHLLNKGLPINKLVNIEDAMSTIVRNTPEYSNLSIISSDGSLMYIADPEGVAKEVFSGFEERQAALLENEHQLLFPITDPLNPDKNAAYIKVNINKRLMESFNRTILLDYSTVIIIAILISFEILIFFISRAFSLSVQGNSSIKTSSIIPIAMVRNMGFLCLFGTFMFIPFFPIFLKDLSRPILGLSKEIVTGLPISVYMLASTAGFLLKDKLRNRFGYGITLLSGSLICACGLFLTGMANDIVQVIFIQVINGVGFGIIYLIPQTLVIENTAGDNKLAFSRLFAGFYGGIICGSAIGGILIEKFGYRPVFLFAAGITACIYPFFYLNLSPYLKQRKNESRIEPSLQEEPPVRKLLADKAYLVPVLTQGIPYQIIYVGLLFFVLPLYLRSVSISTSDIGRLIMLHGSVIVLGPFIIRMLSRYMKSKTQLISAGITISIMLLSSIYIFKLADKFSILFLMIPWIIIIAICNCIQSSNIVTCSMTSPAAKQIGQGSALSIYRIIERIGNVTAPIICSSLIGLFAIMGHETDKYLYTMAIIGTIFLCGTIAFTIWFKENSNG